MLGNLIHFGASRHNVAQAVPGLFALGDADAQNRAFKIVVQNDGEAPVTIAPVGVVSAVTHLTSGTQLLTPAGAAASVAVAPGASRVLEFYALPAYSHFGFTVTANLATAVPGNVLLGEGATRTPRAFGRIRFVEPGMREPIGTAVPNNMVG